MSYDVALSKAWAELEKTTQEKDHRVCFFADEYSVNIKSRRILSLSCNVASGDYLSILILHYLIRSLKGLPAIEQEWISFRQLSGGLGYYPTFKKRVIERILRKYGANPQALLQTTERLKAKKVQLADASIILEVFERVPVLITVWRQDEELDSCANIHFDRSIKGIFCTEDIVVMSEFVASNI